MELGSLFLVRINLFFPLPSTMSAHTLHIAVPGADDTCERAWWSILIQIWHDETWENLDQMIKGRNKSTFNSVPVLNVSACCMHLKCVWIQKQGRWTRTMCGLVHGQSTGWGWHFTGSFCIEYCGNVRCGIDSPSDLSTILTIRPWGREMLMASCPSILPYRDCRQKKRLSRIFMH